MTNKEILQADMLDILFEHRNKLYGAYELRKTYSSRLGKALGLALGIAVTVICFSFINNNRNRNGVKIDSNPYVMTDVNLEDKVEEEIKPKEKPPQRSTADYNQIVVVPDDKADNDIPDKDKISESIIGNENIEGESDDGTTKQVIDNNAGTGEQTIKEPEEIKQPDLPTRGPEFPGGEAAWIAFLRRYLQAPEDLEPGQTVQVVVQFWVDVDGSVSRTSVMKSGGSSFDKEVLRVIKKMPKWMPALQHGNPVAVPYSQPVTFMGVEQ